MCFLYVQKAEDHFTCSNIKKILEELLISIDQFCNVFKVMDVSSAYT